jgi:hypothetical protein
MVREVIEDAACAGGAIAACNALAVEENVFTLSAFTTPLKWVFVFR